VSFTSHHDQDVKEQIRQATDIVDLVGGYLQLRRQGHGYVALCPWHDDQHPSLQVNPERQSWKCWVCDIGGDVFSFVMQREGVDFREALEMLADRAGVSLRSPSGPRPQPGSPGDKRTLYQAAEWAEDQFHRCLLHTREAEPARRYLKERGITSESVERFRLGFSPDSWQWLLDRARTTPFSPQVLEAAGLCAKSDKSGRFYDFFRGRLLFSIRDVQNRPIAFGGRVLPGHEDDRTGKYINSRETRIFSKSDQLYGLHIARDAGGKKQEREREIVVVEGYTDVVMAHQCGVDNVVAVLGTALGSRHIRLLRRFADRINLVLDADEAGQSRTNEILELFVAEQVDLRILTLPEGLDPCDFVFEHGADAFRKLLGGARDALDHKVHVATEGINLATETHRANQALETILSTIARAPRPQLGTATEVRLREQQILARMARQFNVAESVIRDRLNELRRKTSRGRQNAAPSAQQPPAGPPKVRELDVREVELLEVLVSHPELVADAVSEIEIGHLRSETLRAIYGTIHGIHDERGTPDFGNVLTALEDPRLKNIWVELDERAHAKAEEALEDARKRLQGLIDEFRYALQDEASRRELAALEEKRLSEQEELDALKKLIAQRRDRQGISAPTEG